MNGATTDPCANTKRPPNTIIIKIIGANHSFFLTRKNFQISIINAIISNLS